MKSQENTQDSNRKNWLEWTIFVIGSAISIAVLIYLVYALVVYSPGEPDLSTEFKLPAHPSNKVKIIIRNKGNVTAEDVTVSAQLFRNGRELEKGEIELEYVPKQSKKSAWIIFEHQIGPNDSIKTRIQSYLTP